jgi:AraC family transcriptional regulator
MQQPILNLSTVAAQLLEAASHARAGDCSNAHARIVRAIELLQGNPCPAAQITGVQTVESRQAGRGGLLAWQARRVIAHVDANLDRRISVSELAALVPLSSSYFHRAFKCTFGVGPHTYLTRRRIEAAQGLMLTTRDSLTEIALTCGLADQSHLSRWFRRIVGESPRAWRRMRRGEIEDESRLSRGWICRLEGSERINVPGCAVRSGER